MDKPLMKCGHTANAQTSDGKPVCIICLGIVAGADEIADVQPDLTGRIARCNYGDSTTPSSFNLPFFEYRPDRTEDAYYCGCWGWD